MRISWDGTGKRVYETGVDRMVLYKWNRENRCFENGVPWNGITSFDESPSGAEPTSLYGDNIKYLNLISAEEYGATISAYTYPDEFEECDGSILIAPGVYIGQQARSLFALCYRTLLGNDIEGVDHGYKLHLVYNCLASPSQKNHQTINDSPEASNPSWDISTTPIDAGRRMLPTSTLVVDSTKSDPEAMKTLEDFLYGTDSLNAALPHPDDIVGFLISWRRYPSESIFPGALVYPKHP